MYDINLFTFHIIKQHYSFETRKEVKYVIKMIFIYIFHIIKQNHQSRRQDTVDSARLETYHVRAAQ